MGDRRCYHWQFFEDALRRLHCSPKIGRHDDINLAVMGARQGKGGRLDLSLVIIGAGSVGSGSSYNRGGAVGSGSPWKEVIT